MRVKKSYVLLLLISLLALLIPSATAQMEPETYDLTYQINAYTKTKIIVTYTFTDAVTGNVSSAGQSRWVQHNTPLTSSFETELADRYTWDIDIKYYNVITQTVTISIFSGLEAVDTTKFAATTDHIQLSFDIIATEQPRYPTAEEIADMSIEVLSEEMSEWQAEMRKNTEVQLLNVTVLWIIAVLSFTVSTISLVMYMKNKEKQQYD